MHEKATAYFTLNFAIMIKIWFNSPPFFYEELSSLFVCFYKGTIWVFTLISAFYLPYPFY